MKEILNITDELLKVQTSIRGNISIWTGAPGSGKSQELKRVANMIVDNGDKVIIFSQEAEHFDIIKERIKENKTLEGLNLFENTLRSDRSFFGKNSILPMLQDMHNILGKYPLGTKTIIFIDEFTDIFDSEREYILFLELAKDLRRVGAEFILISQDLDYMNDYLKGLYLLNCKEICNFKR